MIYMNVLVSDLLANKVFTQKEWEFLDTLKIPYPSREGVDSNALWREKQRLDGLLIAAVESGKVNLIPPERVEPRQAAYVQSDCIGEGVQGVFNPVNGKKYDSKSSYYKAVKDAGCVVLGNDAPKEAKGPRAKINDRELKHDIKTAIEQLGG